MNTLTDTLSALILVASIPAMIDSIAGKVLRYAELLGTSARELLARQLLVFRIVHILITPIHPKMATVKDSSQSLERASLVKLQTRRQKHGSKWNKGIRR